MAPFRETACHPSIVPGTASSSAEGWRCPFLSGVRSIFCCSLGHGLSSDLLWSCKSQREGGQATQLRHVAQLQHDSKKRAAPRQQGAAAVRKELHGGALLPVPKPRVPKLQDPGIRSAAAPGTGLQQEGEGSCRVGGEGRQAARVGLSGVRAELNLFCLC